MDMLAENRFTLTKELFYESMRRVLAESYGKFAKKAVAVLAAAWLLLVAFTLWQGHGIGSCVLEFFILGLVSLYITVYVPRSRAKRAFKNLENRDGENMERCTRFYSDELTAGSAGREKTLSYSEIKQVLHSRNLLILIAEDGTGIMLKKDSYTRGTEAAVLDRIMAARAEEDNTHD